MIEYSYFLLNIAIFLNWDDVSDDERNVINESQLCI